jgi:hypothetical protein
MADTTPDPTVEPTTAVDPPGASPATDPNMTPPGWVDPTPDAEPTKAKPIVLATRDRQTRFVLPGAGPKDTDLVVDHHGVALSKKDADALEAAASGAGVHLIDITPPSELPTEKD